VEGGAALVSENGAIAQHYVIRSLAIRLVLLAACYLLASLTQVNHLVYTLTKGYYRFYQFAFYASLYVLSYAVVSPRPSIRMGLVLPAGPIIGYLSGLVAFFLLPLGRGEKLSRILTTRDLSSEFFWSPCVTFSWLVGFYFLLLIAFLQRD
jgi:hypothetical protein